MRKRPQLQPALVGPPRRRRTRRSTDRWHRSFCLGYVDFSSKQSKVWNHRIGQGTRSVELAARLEVQLRVARAKNDDVPLLLTTSWRHKTSPGCAEDTTSAVNIGALGTIWAVTSVLHVLVGRLPYRATTEAVLRIRTCFLLSAISCVLGLVVPSSPGF